MNIKEKVASLPQKPGCYLMKNSDGEIIYVGKAKVLANRVKSYFMGSHNAKTTAMISHIADFEYIITATEAEAFILEINLIKKHNPKYNILLTDDKSYPYILITNEKNPKIIYTRELKYKGKYFGPYPSSASARETSELLNKMYPLRKCNHLPKKECLYYHIGECLAPCIKEIPKEAYDEIKNKIYSFLSGNVTTEIKRYEKLMYEASDKLDFEKAREYLKIINNIKSLLEKQNMDNSLLDSDIFGYYINDEYISIQIFHIRDSKMVERNGFLFELMGDEIEIFLNFIGQFYLVKQNPLPKEILLPELDYSSLSDEIKRKIIVPKKGKKKDMVKLVTENAKEKIDVLSQKEELKKKRTIGAITTLGEILGIGVPTNIEAFDNSNIQGVSSVSAMVSYLDGEKNPKGYRKFLIKTVEGANDALTMHEVVTRRYSRLKKEGKPFPNLIIMDGGKPQVNSALKALELIDVKIPVMGLVKNDNHKTEAILFNNEEIALDKKSNLFYFLEAMQDEVHRYAISFHHLRHGKDTFSSLLDNIKGIGPVKKKQILKIIGTMDFLEKLEKLKLTKTQKEEIKKIYDTR